MGLSVSAAAGIVLIGVILIFGTLYPAIQSSEDMKNEAKREWFDRRDKEQRSDMNVSSVNYTESQDRVNITLENTGDTTLHIGEIEVLLNGTCSSEKISRWIVDGSITNTDLWNPGQDLKLILEDIHVKNVRRVAVVNEFGTSVYHTTGS
ncbi:MAG: hypothetical protein KGY76_09395 [Candidatus Thermoplasmatota archaeon]|nr:hypothetical protein [Candidatus Thermoplasmatota archaeon]